MASLLDAIQGFQAAASIPDIFKRREMLSSQQQMLADQQKMQDALAQYAPQFAQSKEQLAMLAPQLSQQQLRRSQLANQYYGPQMQSNLASAISRRHLLDAQIGLTNQQAKKLATEQQYIPQQMQASLLRAQAQQQNAPSLAMSRIFRGLPSNIKNALLQNPQMASAFFTNAQRQMGGGVNSGQGVASIPHGQVPNQIPVSGQQQVISPQAQAIALAARAGLSKGVTPATQQNRAYYGANALQTMNMIMPNLDSASKFTGLMGKQKETEGYLKSALGFKADDNYNKYQQFKQGATILADQIRQFYGASITPQMVDRIEKLINPPIGISPNAYKDNFNFLRNVLLKEHGTVTKSIGYIQSPDLEKRLGSSISSQKTSGTKQGMSNKDYISSLLGN